MRIEHFELSLRKRAELFGVRYQFGPAATVGQLEQAEAQLGVQLPSQVRLFFRTHNGMQVEAPPLEVFPVHRLRRDNFGKIPFAAIDEKHLLCFESSQLNDAGQWTITNLESGYVVTLTMASFWSNKVFAWLDKKRPIWEEEKHA